MQHYDIPTRLLDFTLNPLIALYFCVSFFTEDTGAILNKTKSVTEEIDDYLRSDGFSEKGGAIYCIKPESINYESKTFASSVIDLNKYDFESLSNIDFPVCIKGNSIDSRIKAQEGVFVYFGSWIHALDWYDILQPHIVKIFVPNSLKQKIKTELRENFNISHQTMFPDMKGVSLEIIDKMNEEFSLRSRNEVKNVNGRTSGAL